MSQENVELAWRASRAWNDGGVEALIGYLDTDVEWHPPTESLEPGTYRGHDGASSITGGLGARTEGPHSWIGGGLHNVASGEYSSVVGGTENNAKANYTSILGGKLEEATVEFEHKP